MVRCSLSFCGLFIEVFDTLLHATTCANSLFWAAKITRLKWMLVKIGVMSALHLLAHNMEIFPWHFHIYACPQLVLTVFYMTTQFGLEADKETILDTFSELHIPLFITYHQSHLYATILLLLWLYEIITSNSCFHVHTYDPLQVQDPTICSCWLLLNHFLMESPRNPTGKCLIHRLPLKLYIYEQSIHCQKNKWAWTWFIHSCFLVVRWVCWVPFLTWACCTWK